jgi:hypothetical protein
VKLGNQWWLTCTCADLAEDPRQQRACSPLNVSNGQSVTYTSFHDTVSMAVALSFRTLPENVLPPRMHLTIAPMWVHMYGHMHAVS